VSGIKEQLEDEIHGKRFMRELEREAEVEHERLLAAIRAQPHTLTWKGTAEELRATITGLYVSGQIEAVSLEDALQRAALHFVIPATLSTPASSGPLKSSPQTNRERIDAFIQRLKDAGVTVKRKDIWVAAGYKDPTEFERFQRGTTANKAAIATFNRILGMAHSDFKRLCAGKQVQPNSR
jgi:hypothetical protein